MMMYAQSNNNMINHQTPCTYIYPSWSEVVQRLYHEKPKWLLNEASQHSDAIEWSGTYTYQQAIDYLRDGWPQGLAKLREFQRKLPPDIFDCVMPISDYKLELRHSIAGGSIDMPLHITGASPEVFVSEQLPMDTDIKRGNRLATIYMQTFNSCFTNEDAFFWRGAYVFALVEHLEQCGYSVEFWLVNHGSDGSPAGDEQRIYVRAKEFGELLDTNKLAVTTASSFMLRRFMFRLQELVPDREIAEYVTRHAYLRPPANYDVVLSDDADTNPIYINTVNQSSSTEMLTEFKRILEQWVGTTVVAE